MELQAPPLKTGLGAAEPNEDELLGFLLSKTASTEKVLLLWEGPGQG